VSVVGMAHGVLFVLFVAAAAHAALTVRWPLSRTLMVLGAAVVPAGPFAIDGWLKRQQEAAARENAKFVARGYFSPSSIIACSSP
jgi:hypothetical protein